METVEELVKELNIERYGNLEKGALDFVFEIKDSSAYGSVYVLLENSPIISLLPDNQVVTTEGSSLLYEVDGMPYILNLIADWEGDVYQLIFTRMDE